MLAFNHLGTLGRLGNQMFQYASLRGIAAKKGYDFGIPPSNFKDEWRNHQLFQVFELSNLPQQNVSCLLYTSPSPRDRTRSRMPSSA